MANYASPEATRLFTPDHAMSCAFGGFPTIRHNELRNIIGELLTEVGHNVAIEPLLQPLSGEVFRARSTTTSMKHDRISVPLDSGQGGRTRSSTSEFFMQTPLPTEPGLSRRHVGTTNT